MTGGGGGGSGTATIDAPLIVNDTITLNSSMTASGDVTAAGVSVSGHTHTGDSGGTTSPPN
jgi:phage baseplate assembly protein gpV